jgi:hypothetical protein
MNVEEGVETTGHGFNCSRVENAPVLVCFASSHAYGETNTFGCSQHGIENAAPS